MQLILSKRRGAILVFAIIIIVIVIALYFTPNLSQEKTNVNISDIVPTSTVISSPTLTSSPISPISSISPMSSVPASEPREESNIDIIFEAGVEAYQRGAYEIAIEKFEAVITLNPSSARAYDGRGTVYTALGELENALEDYSKAIEVDPQFPPPYYNRGRVYSQLERYDDALADLQTSIDLAPFFFGYRANGNIGIIYHQLGEYEKALEAFAESISFNDENADVYYLRGETYTAMENYEAAIADYQAAIERFSRYDLALQSIGYAFYKTGQFDLALDNLNQALETSPDSPIAHLYLGLVYLATNQPDKAVSITSQGMDSISMLPEDEQEALLTRVLADLETIAQDQPDKSETVEAIIDLIEAR